MSTTAPTVPSDRRWKIAFATAIALGPLLGALGTAWAAQTFPDVPPSHTFYEEIEWGAQHDIINGFPDGTFRPGQPVSRGAAAAFLSHYNDAIHTVTATVDPTANDTFFHSVSCPVGERAIGGTASSSSANLFITDLTGETSYGARWESDNNAVVDPVFLRVTAVCAPNSVANPPTVSDDPALAKADE